MNKQKSKQTKLQRALQIEQEELALTPDRERIDVILDPIMLIQTTCPSYYGMLDNCKLKCKDCWNEEV